MADEPISPAREDGEGNHDPVEQFAHRHPERTREWAKMSHAERQWWRRKYRAAQKRIRRHLHT